MVALLLVVMWAGSSQRTFMHLGAWHNENQRPELAAYLSQLKFLCILFTCVPGSSWDYERGLIPNMIITWLWSFVPKLKLGLGILGEFCTDIQDEVLGASKLAKKWLYIVIQAYCICSIFLHIFLFTFLLFKVSRK